MDKSPAVALACSPHKDKNIADSAINLNSLPFAMKGPPSSKQSGSEKEPEQRGKGT